MFIPQFLVLHHYNNNNNTNDTKHETIRFNCNHQTYKKNHIVASSAAIDLFAFCHMVKIKLKLKFTRGKKKQTLMSRTRIQRLTITSLSLESSLLLLLWLLCCGLVKAVIHFYIEYSGKFRTAFTNRCMPLKSYQN